MASRKSILGLGLCAALAYAGSDWCEKNVEVVTLHASGRTDSYPRLFVIDDPPVLWVRAERPDRIWLQSVRDNPAVVVQRGERDAAYHAEIGAGDRERIDAMFRAKYGFLDRLSAWVWQRDEVLVRLEPAENRISG
jgi:hypothetical protein